MASVERAATGGSSKTRRAPRAREWWSYLTIRVVTPSQVRRLLAFVTHERAFNCAPGIAGLLAAHPLQESQSNAAVQLRRANSLQLDREEDA